MNEYKADITLNEKDALNDLLILEKTLVKVYATALTESVSKGFRTIVQEHLLSTSKIQETVFFLMTERDYVRVVSAKEEALDKIKKEFEKVKKEIKK